MGTPHELWYDSRRMYGSRLLIGVSKNTADSVRTNAGSSFEIAGSRFEMTGSWFEMAGSWFEIAGSLVEIKRDWLR